MRLPFSGLNKPPSFSSGLAKAELVEKLRKFLGVRGAPQLHLMDGVVAHVLMADLTDHGYSEDPVWWLGGDEQAAVGAQNSLVGFQGGAKRSTVDGFIAWSATQNGTRITLQRVSQNIANTSPTFVTSRPGAPTAAQMGVLKGSQVGFPLVTTLGYLGTWIVGSIAESWKPLQMRFGAPGADGTKDAFMVFNQTLNSALEVVAWGREWSE